MSLLNYSLDTVLIILSFLDNKSGIKMMSTCRSINLNGRKNGFLTSLKLDNKIDAMDFFKQCIKHQETLKKITICGYDNPHMWIPQYIETLIFDHCSVLECIDPPEIVYETKYIKITDYHRLRLKNKLYINWSKFPNLEHLELYVYSVDLSGLDTTKLKICNINSLKI